MAIPTKLFTIAGTSSFVTFESTKRKEYFFSTDHCQRFCPGSRLSRDFVPVTTYLPHQVAPRPGFPDGWIRTVEESIRLYNHDRREIPNPDPRFQPE